MFNQTILDEIRQQTYEKDKSFPYLVALLKHAGVTTYHVDMKTRTTHFCSRDGSNYIEQGHDDAVIADVFDQKMVVAALRAHQKGETDFVTRLNDTRNAGCSEYIVDLTKMIVTYSGNDCDESYIEDIPEVFL